MSKINYTDEEKEIAINNKIQNLQLERKNVIDYLLKQNIEKKKIHVNQEKLKDRHKILRRTLNSNTLNAKQNLAEKDSNYLNNRRSVQINEYELKERENKIYISKITLIYLLIIIAGAIFKKIHIINRGILNIYIVIFTLIYIIIILFNLYKNSKRSSYDWDVFEFKKKRIRKSDKNKCVNY
jgi:hypothetical protein